MPPATPEAAAASWLPLMTTAPCFSELAGAVHHVCGIGAVADEIAQDHPAVDAVTLGMRNARVERLPVAVNVGQKRYTHETAVPSLTHTVPFGPCN